MESILNFRFGHPCATPNKNVLLCPWIFVALVELCFFVQEKASYKYILFTVASFRETSTLTAIQGVSDDISSGVKLLTAVCVNVCVHASHLFFLPANTLPPIIMYILCFVGPRRMSSLSTHQTFMVQKRIYISRDPAQLNLALLLRPVIALSVCSTSQCLTWLPLPTPSHT